MLTIVLILVLFAFFLFVSAPNRLCQDYDATYIKWWEKNISVLSNEKLIEAAQEMQTALKKGREKNGAKKLYRQIEAELKRRGICIDAN